MWHRILRTLILLYITTCSVIADSAVQSFDANAFGDEAVLGCDFVGTVGLGSDVSN